MSTKQDTTTNDKSFSQHAKDDAALSQPETTTTDKKQGLTMIGKVTMFLLFPTTVGLFGLYAGYMAKRNDPDRELSFDSDFALPFVLTLVMCIVIGFQTNGFTRKEPKPLVVWPKVKKRRRVVHKHVVVGQHPDEVKDEDDDDEDDATDAKKKD